MRTFLFDDAEIGIIFPDGSKVAIFDVSPTVYNNWIAIGIGGSQWLLETFADLRRLMEFIANRQLDGAQIIDGAEMLDGFVQGNGWDNWSEYVADFKREQEAAPLHQQ